MQVVPVFASVQKAIESEAEGWNRTLGDQMEKSGEKAGQRAGKAMAKEIEAEGKKAADDYAGHFETSIKRIVKSAERELGRLDLSTASEKMLADLDQAKKKLRELNDQDFNLDFDAKKVIADLNALKGAVEGLTRGDHEINIDSNIKKTLRDIEAGLKFVDAEIERDRVIEIEVDTKSAEREMSLFEKQFKRTADRAAKHLSGSMNKEAKRLRTELKYLENLRIGIDISADSARSEIKEIMAELERLSNNEDIDIRLDTSAAKGEIAAFEAVLHKLEQDDIDIDVDVNTAAARAKLAGLSRSGDDAANSFRSFNIVLLAAASAGPALVPVLGAIAGGLLAIGPAAAVAGFSLTSVLIGFSGIGDAITALQAREDEMAGTVADAAKRQIGNAGQVAAARRSAADQIESALEQQADAQERYRDSIDDVREAEEALREAREAAKGTGEDLDLQIRSNDLALDQALLDSFNATVTFNSVMADGSSTNAEQEQARIDREEALLRLEELRAEQKRLAEEKRKWDKEGVNGTEEVTTAQENLNDAMEAQKDAYEDLRDAARDVDKARADGARAVAEAMRGQAQAMEQVSAQQRNVDTAMSKLGPAGQKFAEFIFALRDDFYAFRDDIQTVMLPSIQEAIEGFFESASGSTLRKAMIRLAAGFGDFVLALSKSFQGGVWLKFFETLARLGPDIQKAYGAAFIAFLEAMASILTTLAPFALEFAEGLAKMAQGFADWAASKAGQDQINAFLDYVRQVGPDVIEFLKAFGRFAIVVAQGLAQWGDTVLQGITGMLNAFANLDPAVLAALVTTIFILITASQTAYAIMNLLLAGAALLTSTVGVIVFAIVGIGLALVYLYKKNEDFRNFVDRAWSRISKAFEDAWEIIKPALMNLWDAIQELWDKVLRPFFEWLGPILVRVAEELIPILATVFAGMVDAIAWAIDNILIPGIELIAKFFRWLWKKVLKPTWGLIEKAWSALVKAFKWAWKNIMKPVIDAISVAAKWLWKNVLKPVWEDMQEAWDDMMTGMRWTWRNILKPVIDFIADKALPKLKTAFETAVDAIKTIWDGLKKVVAAPIKFVLKTVINDGLIAGFNKVAGWVGHDGVDKIDIPDAINNAYATGGIMPGYSPGRDVHHFTSPTGGRLHLSGGEAIMRPEWTAAMGAGYVEQMNSIARAEGVSGLRKRMGGRAFAKGGIFFPLPGGHYSDNYSGHDGVDINVGSGSDDLGMTYYSATSGKVTTTGYSRGYGNAVFVASPYGELVYGHSLDGSIMVRPGQSVAPGSPLARVGSTGNSSGPHLHFGFPGGTYGMATALLAGSPIGVPGVPLPGATDVHHRKIPSWLMDIVKNPLSAVKGWVTDTWDKASSAIKSPFFDTVKNLPMVAARKVTDKVWDVVPGWVKTAAGWAGDSAKWVVGGVKNAGNVSGAVGNVVGDFLGISDGDVGLRRGGILPYNGTMKYDSGGYLPPGLTSVVNLTGRPEPVFTADQWDGMEGGGSGETYHYEPHFDGSNLTAEDVAGDVNFGMRRLRRTGKYGKVGQP